MKLHKVGYYNVANTLSDIKLHIYLKELNYEKRSLEKTNFEKTIRYYYYYYFAISSITDSICKT